MQKVIPYLAMKQVEGHPELYQFEDHFFLFYKQTVTPRGSTSSLSMVSFLHVNYPRQKSIDVLRAVLLTLRGMYAAVSTPYEYCQVEGCDVKIEVPDPEEEYNGAPVIVFIVPIQPGEEGKQSWARAVHDRAALEATVSPCGIVQITKYRFGPACATGTAGLLNAVEGTLGRFRRKGGDEEKKEPDSVMDNNDAYDGFLDDMAYMLADVWEERGGGRISQIEREKLNDHITAWFNDKRDV